MPSSPQPRGSQVHTPHHSNRDSTGRLTAAQAPRGCPAAGLQPMPKGSVEPTQSFQHGNPSFPGPHVSASAPKTKAKILDTQKGGGGVGEKVLLPALRWDWAKSCCPVLWPEPPETPRGRPKVALALTGRDRNRVWDPICQPRTLVTASYCVVMWTNPINSCTQLSGE